MIRTLRVRATVWILGLAVLGVAAVAPPAEAIRVVTYNLLNYPNKYVSRNPDFRTVFTNMPAMDVVCVQEVQGLSGMIRFQADVLNTLEPDAWLRAPYFDNSNFNQGLFYRTSTMTFVSADTIGNSPRAIPYYRMRPKPYVSGDAEFILFVHHFKAGATSSDEDDREVEARRIRNFMNDQPPGTRMLLCGDFNMRSWSEAAYQDLVGSEADNDGRLFDPINASGDWYNNFTYRFIHTQSPRTTNLGDGGATGGMDDRFDQILVTTDLLDDEGLATLPSTYRSFGNDGQHYNTSIVSAPTIPEGATVASALHEASDHLPVYVDFQVPSIIDVASSVDFGTVIEGATADQILTVTNTASLPADELDYGYSAPGGFTAPGGTLQADAGAAGNDDTISMATATFGAKAGTLVVSSDDVDSPSVDVILSGTVLRHGSPSLASGSAVLSDVIDFGTFNEGSAPPESALVWNFGFDALQAEIEVYDAEITGGEGRFGLAGGFAAAVVGGSPASFGITFDDAEAGRNPDTTYTATLTLLTRDEMLPGSTDLSDLVLTLTATVAAESTQIAVGDPAVPGIAMLRANYPNPFHSGTRVQFEIVRSGRTRLTVYDVQGRVVRTLADEWMPTGAFERSWDGLTDAGREAIPGIYFMDLSGPGFRQSRRMTKLQ